jgi:hypothetical protein
VDNAPSELHDARERLREIRDAAIRQREAITRAPATLVQPERRASLAGLQALAFPLAPLVQGDVEQRLPEAAGASQGVSGNSIKSSGIAVDETAPVGAETLSRASIDRICGAIAFLTPHRARIPVTGTGARSIVGGCLRSSGATCR